MSPGPSPRSPAAPVRSGGAPGIRTQDAYILERSA
jgi:hypothetical protein